MKNLFEYTNDDRHKEWALFRVGGVWRVLILWDKAVNWGWCISLHSSVQSITLGRLLIAF
jgi:hypothetical protein